MSILAFLLANWRYIAAAAALAGAAAWGASAMHKWDKSDIADAQNELKDYKAQAYVMAQRMRDKKKAQDDLNKQRKESADDALKNERAATASAQRGWMQLAASRATAGYLPSPGTISESAAGTTCINAANGERVMGQVDAGGARIAAERDSCYIALNNAKRFAQSRTE